MHVPQSSTASSLATPFLAFSLSDYAAFAQSVDCRYGIRLGEYRREQMLRRLRTLAESKGCRSFAALLEVMQQDSGAKQDFFSTMTINVTELLRNPEHFAELSAVFLPELLAAPRTGPFQAWSAGCSYGAEAYSLAMLLHEAAPAGLSRITATDIDTAVLAKANQISFCEQDMARVSLERRVAHFADCGETGLPCLGPLSPRYRPLDHLLRPVRFARHDLLADPYPTAEYDLILCRNVLIYFTDTAKSRIYTGFAQALRPGGILFVGGTERIPNCRQVGLDLIRPFFYRRPIS